MSLVEPAGNTAPVASFTSNCAVYTTCTFNSAETVDAQGDVIRYAWNFGDTGHQHVGQPVAHLRGAGDLHGHADGHRRVGQVDHGRPTT